MTFEVTWMGPEQRVLEVERVRKRDLSAAIRYAGRRLAEGTGGGLFAHGVHVKPAK